MQEPQETGVRMRLAASPPRRVFSVGVLYGLGLVVLWLAFARPPAFGWAALLIVAALAALWAGERLRRATTLALELTDEGLRDSTGRWLARWDEIETIDRGAFALKPSNGFVLRLRDAGPRIWVPGLWWRFGRRVGVGGATPMRATKAMAEAIAFHLAERH